MIGLLNKFQRCVCFFFYLLCFILYAEFIIETRNNVGDELAKTKSSTNEKKLHRFN
jgi:hypothetical protein